MKYLCISVIFFLSCQSTEQDQTDYLQAEEVQLNTPIINLTSSIFEASREVEMVMAYEGAEIRYTLDGSVPKPNSKLYTAPFNVNESCVLKAKAMHAELKSSKTNEIQLIKVKPVAEKIKSVQLNAKPNEKYQAEGTASLFDLKKGSFDFKNNSWLGFDGGILEAEVSFNEPLDVGIIRLSMLKNHGSWIFLPREVNVYVEGKVERLTIETPKGDEPNLMKYIEVPINQKGLTECKIEIIGLKEIPEWHVGKGTTPWLFIDEIIID